MTIDDVWRYGLCNWQQSMRMLNMGVNTYQRWKRLGHIPITTQWRIEDVTEGVLRADMILKNGGYKRE